MRSPVIGNYIGIDVDGVVAEIHTPWIQWLKARFGVVIEEFTYWNHPLDLVGKAAFDFLTPSIYLTDIVKPIPGALAAVNAIRDQGHQVVYVTDCANDSHAAKRDWLQRHGFLRGDHEGHRMVPMSDKTNAPVHILIDDGIHNCRAFRGVSLLVNASHNRDEQWRGVRINHLSEALPYLGI